MHESQNINTNNKPKKTNRLRFGMLLTILVILIIVWGVIRLGDLPGQLITEVQRLASVMSLIQSAYVEEPDLTRLSDGAIEGMLKRLDPHSIYIPPKEQSQVEERDLGEFEGIGISFMIRNELITVIAPIAGSPSDRLGIRAGDRIIEIDMVSAFGITTDEVFQKLRGPKGSAVKIKVAREGVFEPIDFTIIRDKIPINSVWTSFMLDDSTGYILLNQFMATTDEELHKTLNRLEAAGMTRLIFDLRNNQGGRLSQAVAVADMFIPEGYVLVSRAGRKPENNSSYYSTRRATHPMFDLIVLVNAGSASASEIVAGAVQDLDRGMIVGQTTFGKGLVQMPYLLKDGGVIRISTAHWYTPVGRLVQRPYDKGRGEYYAVRYRDSESQDTTSRQAFTTLGGRSVYESAGIEPDFKVEERLIKGATARLLNERILFALAEEIVAKHGLSESDNFTEFRNDFQIKGKDLKRLVALAKEKDIDYATEFITDDSGYLMSQVKAEIAQLVWNSREYYYHVRIDADPVVIETLKLFNDANEVASVWREG